MSIIFIDFKKWVGDGLSSVDAYAILHVKLQQVIRFHLFNCLLEDTFAYLEIGPRIQQELNTGTSYTFSCLPIFRTNKNMFMSTC